VVVLVVLAVGVVLCVGTTGTSPATDVMTGSFVVLSNDAVQHHAWDGFRSSRIMVVLCVEKEANNGVLDDCCLDADDAFTEKARTQK